MNDGWVSTDVMVKELSKLLTPGQILASILTLIAYGLFEFRMDDNHVLWVRSRNVAGDPLQQIQSNLYQEENNAHKNRFQNPS